VPRHRLALVLPLHKLKLAASEEFMLGSLVVAGAVMPTYRSLHFALEQPWVANAVLLSLAGSVGWYTYSSRAVKRTYLKLRIAEETAQRRVASSGYATSSVLSTLATDAAHHSALVTWAALREKADVDRRATARANAAGGAGWDAGLWVGQDKKSESKLHEGHHRSGPVAPRDQRIDSTHLPELWSSHGMNTTEDRDANESEVYSKGMENAEEVDGHVARWLAAAMAQVQGNATPSPVKPESAPGGVDAALRRLRPSDHLSSLKALGLAATHEPRGAVVEGDVEGSSRGIVLGHRALAVPSPLEFELDESK